MVVSLSFRVVIETDSLSLADDRLRRSDLRHRMVPLVLRWSQEYSRRKLVLFRMSREGGEARWTEKEVRRGILKIDSRLLAQWRFSCFSVVDEPVRDCVKSLIGCKLLKSDRSECW